MATVVISAYKVASKPEIGGHFWVYLQYVQGLRRLGCEVFWLERLRRDKLRGDASTAIATFFRRMERYGLGGRAILYETAESDGEAALRFLGVSPAAADAVFRRADLLLNFHYAIDPALLARFGTAVEGVSDLQRLMVADLIDVSVAVSVVRGGSVLELELVPVELGSA